MTKTLQINRYQLCQLMGDFTATTEDKNSIHYNLKIPYSSWKLLKKVSDWEGLISVEYTGKELNFSNGKEIVALVDNYENFPFIDFFYKAYKYKWKCKKTDIVDNPTKTPEGDLTLNQKAIKSSSTLLSPDSTDGTISLSYLNDPQIYNTFTNTNNLSYLSETVTTNDLSQLKDRIDIVETKINSNERKESNTMNMFSALNLDFGPVASNIIRISPFGLAIKTANREWHTYDATNQKIVDVSDFSFSLGDAPILYKMPVAPAAVAVGDLILHNDVPVYVIDFEDE